MNNTHGRLMQTPLDHSPYPCRAAGSSWRRRQRSRRWSPPLRTSRTWRGCPESSGSSSLERPWGTRPWLASCAPSPLWRAAWPAASARGTCPDSASSS